MRGRPPMDRPLLPCLTLAAVQLQLRGVMPFSAAYCAADSS